MDKKNTVKYIFETASGTKWKIGLLLFMRAAIASVNVASALILRDIINAAIAHSSVQFYSKAAVFVGVVCIRVAAGAANRFLQEDICSELENKWKYRLFSVLLGKNYAYVSMIHSGEWMTRLTNDTVIVANGMTNLLPDMGGMFVRLIGAAGAILLMEPRFIYVIIPGGMILITISYISRKKMKQLHKDVQQEDGKLRTFLQECFSGMLVVRSYGTEQFAADEAAKKMKKHKKARMKRNRFSNICNTGFSVLMNATYIAGACYCGYGILTGTITYGTFTAVLQLIGQLQNPLANISGILPRYYAMISSAERLMEAENVDDVDLSKRKTLDDVLKVYQAGLEKIVLKDISFSYLLPDQQPGMDNRPYDLSIENHEKFLALSGWNFEIQKGQYVAITGPSGCGKSTLLKLFMCLYEPDKGERYLKIDGKKVCLDGSWQRLFAYVPQGNYLMSGTIREMVVFSDNNQLDNDPEIWNALAIACADGFVRELERGIDTVLGERGSGLSEGQMQRLAIARAVFSRSPIMILDECSSALDEATETQLLNNLRSMTDRTVIIITHRPAALKICDKICCVDETLLLTNENIY